MSLLHLNVTVKIHHLRFVTEQNQQLFDKNKVMNNIHTTELILKKKKKRSKFEYFFFYQNISIT